MVVGRHGDGLRAALPWAAAEGLGRAGGPPALGVERGQVGEHRADRPADDELRQVHPVSTDVGDRAEVRPAVGLDAPVVVVGLEEPVLGVGAGHAQDAPRRRRGRPGAELVTERVEPDVVIDGRHLARTVRGERDQRPGLARGRCQRLLANHVFARQQCRPRLREVAGVGRGDVDGADRGVSQQGGEVGVDPLDPEPAGQRLGPFGGRAEEPHHRDTDPPQRLGVNGPDEASADQRDPGTTMLRGGRGRR